MNEAQLKAIVDSTFLSVQSYVEARIKQSEMAIRAALETTLKSVINQDLIEQIVRANIPQVKDGEPGKDAVIDVEQLRTLISEQMPEPLPGPAGPEGPVGKDGPQGERGPEGPIGKEGPPGPQGPQGATGIAGPAGERGEKGADGLPGPIGPQGPAGEAGPPGPQGERGIEGPAGPEGKAGPQGERGEKGEQGLPGPIGPQGERGEKGEQGLSGSIGPIGPIGPQGERGFPGPAGPQGERGAEGPVGKQGPAGRDAMEIEICPLLDPTKSYARGTWARDGGGLVRAHRNTVPLQEVGLDYERAGWEVMVNGLRSFSIEMEEDARTLCIKAHCTNGDAQEIKTKTPAIIDRGVFAPSRAYEKGDAVTYDGQFWIARQDVAEGEQPGTSKVWRLAVRKGRDGRDAGQEQKKIEQVRIK